MTDRVRIKGGFTAIPNDLLRSDQLGLEHKGMLALIASHTDSWDFRQADMLKKAKCSKDRYYRIINDLKAKGYLDIVPRDTVNGRFSGADWVLNFLPCPENQEAVPCPENQDVPCPEKPDTENQDDKKNNIKNTKRISVAGPQKKDHFSDFWAIHPRSKDIEASQRLFNEAVEAGVDPEEIIKAAERYGQDQSGNNYRFICGSDAWLERKGWMDGSEQTPPKVDPKQVLQSQADLIKKGKQFLVTQITDATAAQLVSAGFVTKDQCNAVGLRP